MSATNIPNALLYIGGKAVQSTSTEWRDIPNSATQEVVARVPLATKAKVDLAVANAKQTFRTWRNTSLAQRMRIMLKSQQLLRENIAPPAELITSENGKTLPDAEVMRGLEVVEYACAITSLQLGELAGNAATRVDLYTINQPLGVGVGITAFNFPVMPPCFMLPVACSNTFMLKPSEYDPSSSLFLVKLAVYLLCN